MEDDDLWAVSNNSWRLSVPRWASANCGNDDGVAYWSSQHKQAIAIWACNTECGSCYYYDRCAWATSRHGHWGNEETRAEAYRRPGTQLMAGTLPDALTVGPSGYDTCVRTDGASVYQCCTSGGSSDALFVAGPSGGDYDDAVAYCSSIGASIATIYSATENELARQACGGSSCWIGLEEVGGSASTPKASQTWRWMDGSTASYTNWLPTEPQNHNGRDERNAIMNCCDTNGVDASGSWYDAPDDYGAPKPLCRTDDSGGSSGSN